MVDERMKIRSDANEALVSAITKAFRALHNGHVHKPMLMLLIKTMGHVRADSLRERHFPNDFSELDIFTPLIQDQDLEYKLEIIAVLFAFCSVITGLRPLISRSINKWNGLLCRFDCRKPDYSPGFYTIVSFFHTDRSIDEVLASFAQCDLKDVLLNSWIPQWLEYIAEDECKPSSYMARKNIGMALFEDELDFCISTIKPLVSEKNVFEGQSDSFLYFKICQRGILYPNLIEKDVYQKFSEKLLGSDGKEQDLKVNDLEFQLKVLMEFIDHPNDSFIEEPKLIVLLFLSLNKIYDVPCNKLHMTLGLLGTTQTLQAILNIVLFLLCKSLISVGNVFELAHTNLEVQHLASKTNEEWFHSKNYTVNIPLWFQKFLLPSTPPITKSLFLYDSRDWSYNNPAGLTHILDLLFDCVDAVLAMNIKLLKEYANIGFDPLTSDLDSVLVHITDPKIEQIVKTQYLQLYLVSSMTTLLLSKQVSNRDSPIYGAKKYQSKTRLLSVDVIRLCNELIKVHGSIALQNMITFMMKISDEDLLMQSIGLELLRDLIFHNKEEAIIDLLKKNTLSFECLKMFIDTWNDGSEKYQIFYERILEIPQPRVKTSLMSSSELLELLPNHHLLFERLIELRNEGSTMHHKILNNTRNHNFTNYGPGNKFDPYSAASFVPENKASLSPLREECSYNDQNSPNVLKTASSTFWMSGEKDAVKTLASEEQLQILGSSISYKNYIPNGSYNENIQPSFILSSISNISSTPRTPNMSASTMFSNPWDESPNMHSTPNVSKIVSTGKNYILGGHNRIKNNSRAQSIHIDEFEQHYQ